MKSMLATHLVFALAAGSVAIACGSGDDDASGALDQANKGSGGKASVSVGGKSTVPVTGGSSGTNAAGGSSGSSGSNTGNTGPYMLPDGYKEGELGGWLLGVPEVAGEAPPDVGEDGTTSCGSTILGIVRDFKRGDRDGGHPDFETFTGDGQTGIVKQDLGSDDKPVYANVDPKKFTTTEDNFNEWYNDRDDNAPYYIYFSLEPDPAHDNYPTFSSHQFFPLDGKGFGNEDNSHNYHFTTEVHTKFQYNGGEIFEFSGDDDLWVFINKKLAIDLGGLHKSQTKRTELDKDAAKLGITKGNVYALDLFHAERHTDKSNFTVVSNLNFVDCGVIVPSTPVR
jgi:fibro-slime domain-containing protein